jgi:hypothetical protein
MTGVSGAGGVEEQAYEPFEYVKQRKLEQKKTFLDTLRHLLFLHCTTVLPSSNV